MKLAVFALVAVAACGTDERPPTLGYITETILAPSCGVAECHSSLKRQSDYVFDSVASAQDSIKNGNLIAVCDAPPCEDAPGASYLLTVITDGDSAGNRMPIDQPLPNLDAVLIARWITDGAPGYTP
jgi:hypothetical protein